MCYASLPDLSIDADTKLISYKNKAAKSYSLTWFFHTEAFSANTTNFKFFHKEDLVTRGFEGII